MGYYRRQNRKRCEATEQERIMRWAAVEQAEHPELKLLHHIPNGGSRNAAEAANLKRQGVKAGVPDLCLPVARCGFHGLYIELKYGKNTVTDEQAEWLEQLRQQGYKAVPLWGAEQAIETIREYLDEYNNMPCPYEYDGHEQVMQCRTFEECRDCKIAWKEEQEGKKDAAARTESSDQGNK